MCVSKKANWPLGLVSAIQKMHALTIGYLLSPLFVGEQCSVSSPNSAFDFLEPKPIGQDLDKIGGYDHTYCLPKSKEFLAE